MNLCKLLFLFEIKVVQCGVVTSVPLLLVSARNNNNIPGKAPPLSRVPSSSSAAEICANNERDQAEAFPCVLSPSFVWTQPSFDFI